MKTESPTNEPFIERLIRICQDRGHRAELRRYWSDTTRHYAFPVLGRLGALGEHKLPDALTAALYAENPNHQLGGNSLGRAALRLGAGDAFESMERHFRRLLASNGNELEELGEGLHRLFVRLARCENGPVALDYNRLLWDLRRWAKEADDIKTRWACDFWQAPAETASAL